MVNKIWSFFIIIGLFYAIITNNYGLIGNEIISSAERSFKLVCNIFPVMALWLGIMKIASKSGLLKKISKLLNPLLRKVFNEIPDNHESLEYISSNIIANACGLGNAATPFGLKAMDSLQELNDKKEVASNSMITFLILNTSGITIIPTTIISLRMMHNSINPNSIVLLCFISSLITTIVGLFISKLISKVAK